MDAEMLLNIKTSYWAVWLKTAYVSRIMLAGGDLPAYGMVIFHLLMMTDLGDACTSNDTCRPLFRSFKLKSLRCWFASRCAMMRNDFMDGAVVLDMKKCLPDLYCWRLCPAANL